MVAPHIRLSRPAAGDSGAELSSAETFSLVWEALADLLGTATTAVIVRRAARRATDVCPELAELEIAIDGMDYRYAVPRAWHEDDGETPRDFRLLIGELTSLLLELTGPIGVRRLQNLPELRRRRLPTPPPEET